MSKNSSGSRELTAAPEIIEQRIYLLRSQKVVLSTHLADLYGVAPRTLIQAVKRRASRFPSDFMFQLSKDEFDSLRSQIVILEKPILQCSAGSENRTGTAIRFAERPD